MAEERTIFDLIDESRTLTALVGVFGFFALVCTAALLAGYLFGGIYNVAESRGIARQALYEEARSNDERLFLSSFTACKDQNHLTFACVIEGRGVVKYERNAVISDEAVRYALSSIDKVNRDLADGKYLTDHWLFKHFRSRYPASI